MAKTLAGLFKARNLVCLDVALQSPREAWRSLPSLYDYWYDHTGVQEMNERVTVTLPEEVIRNIDLRERNRSKFVLRAVQNELERQRKEELLLSLRAPHPDSESLAQEGIDGWMDSLPQGDNDLVDVDKSTPIKWVPGTGWTAGK